jgi:hypothetical protein
VLIVRRDWVPGRPLRGSTVPDLPAHEMQGWMSPNFGPIGCIGAVLFWLLIVAAVLALLYIPWSLLMHGQ